MGLGIGINCKRCRDQLNYDDGFNRERELCNRCEGIVDFDKDCEDINKKINSENQDDD